MKQNKLLPKSRPGRCMGPADTTSSYKIYVPDTNSVTFTQEFAFVDETSMNNEEESAEIGHSPPSLLFSIIS